MTYSSDHETKLQSRYQRWTRLVEKYSYLARRADMMSIGTPPPQLTDEELQRLVGTLSTDRREAILAALAPDLIALVDTRIQASKRGA